MSEFPKFWETILQRLGLQSFEGIENIRNVLNFMGYTTAQSISKLRKPKELSLFQIEVAKLSTNSLFRAKYPELQNWHLGHGTIDVLKDISNAANSCMSYDIIDVESVKKNVFQRCVKVAPNLILSNVLVELSGKAKCEIICPFDSCKDVPKLSLIKQFDTFAPPKFNVFNFERHINTQHLNKKRKREESPMKTASRSFDISQNQNEIHDTTTLSPVDCEISRENIQEKARDAFKPDSASTSTPIRQSLSTDHSEMTPKTEKISHLTEQLCMAKDKIKALENSAPTVPAMSSLNVLMTPKSARIEELSNDLSVAGKKTNKLLEENILLRHRYMDATGKVRTVCRIKPDTSGDCFDWRCSAGGIQIRKL